MNRSINRFGFTALALIAGSGFVAQAQTSTTGAIQGIVRDAAGKPLAGATVTATSAQIVRTTVTIADGSYRLAMLNPGDWSIKANKAGQSAPAQRVNVLLNNTASTNFKVAAEASAVVAVVASAAVLDLSTTQTGSTLQVDQLSSIPMGRDFNTLAFLAPGTQNSSLGLSISGASGLENSYVVDGLDTTDYRKGFQGATMPTDFFDQVEVQTGGFRPEFSALGGVVNAVTKTGSNQFVGSTWFTGDLAQNQSKAKFNNYYRQAPARLRNDFGFTAGGALVTDKLFYFVGANQINIEDSPGSITPNRLGLSNSPSTDKTTNVYAKVNYFLTPSQQVTATVNSVNQPIVATHIYPNIGTRDTGYSSHSKLLNYGLSYDWTISPTLQLATKLGKTSIKTGVDPTLLAHSVTDSVWFGTGPGAAWAGFAHPTAGIPGDSYTTGGTPDWTDTDNGDNQQFRMDLSWFLGDHFLKVGYSRGKASSEVIDYVNGDGRVSVVAESRTGTRFTPVGDLRYITTTTYANLGSRAAIDFNGFYIQDQWEVKPGLRLSYGVRLETQKITGNDGKVFVEFTDVKDQLQPRLGLTWDVNNDGKTKLSANYAVYQERFPMQAALRTAGNETYVQKLYYGPYYAPYGYYAGASYNNATGAYAVTGTPDSVADYSGYFRDYPHPQDGLKVPKREEYIIGIDHTLANGWTVGAHAKYRKLTRIIEDTVPTDADGNYIDGEGFSILWNPQRGKTYQWTNNKYHGAPGALNTWTNTVFPDPKNNYNSLDVTLDRKTDRYIVSFSYTLSHLHGNYEGIGQTSNGQADANITSTWDYYPYVGSGYLPLDRRHIVKLFGSYTWDLFGGSFSAGGRLNYQSGAPKSYFDNTNDIGGYGNATPENGLYGSRGTLPGQSVVDTHIEYQYKLSAKVKLVPTLDIFNVLNKRTQTAWDQYGTSASGAPNPAQGYESGWLTGRSYRWGLKLTF